MSNIMDERSSNYSEPSNLSEHCNSNETSLSGLTNYEEELSSFKQLYKINFQEHAKHECPEKDVMHYELINLYNTRRSNELEIQSLKRELQETNNIVLLKTASVNELKIKICQQHVNHQNLLRTNKKLENQIYSLNNELELHVKSENWFKEQLHKCQVEKAEVTKENFNLKHSFSEKSNELEVECKDRDKWKAVSEKLQKRGQMERERLLRRIEEIELLINRKTPNPVDNSGIERYYESIIDDLTAEIHRTRANLEERELAFNNYNKENAELLAKITMLQKSLDEKEIIVDQLEIQKVDINNKFVKSLDVVEDLRKRNVHLQTLKEEAEVRLISSNDEKHVIQDTLNIIRNDFEKVKSTHKKLKDELKEKEKIIMELSCQKQKNFMEENWKICTKEELKHNTAEIKALNDAIEYLKQREFELLEEISQRDNEKSVTELKINKFEETISFLQQTLLETEHKYKVSIDNLKKIVKEKDLDVEKLKSHLLETESKIAKRDMTINNLNSDLEYFKNEIKRSRSELQSSSRKIEILNEKEYKGVFENVCEIFEALQQNGSNNEKIEFTTKNESINFIIKKLNRCLEVFHKQFTETIDIKRKFSAEKLKWKENEQRVIKKIENLHEKSNKVSNSCDDTHDLLKSAIMAGFEINCYCSKLRTENENLEKEVRALEAGIRAKDSELMEKQNKFERSYHALLKKVKDHMRGRNLAEKKYAHLQEMHEKSIALHSVPEDNFVLNTVETFDKESSENEDNINEIKTLKYLLQQTEDKNKFLSKELEILNSSIKELNNELKQIVTQNNELKDSLDKKEFNLKNLVSTLQTDMQVLENDLNSVKNEKYFLQRLCNDLKLALHSSTNHCKVLKQTIDQREFSCPPDLLPSPSKLDEAHINRLLQESVEMPTLVTLGDLQACLNSLKKELCSLQAEVSEKTLCCL